MTIALNHLRRDRHRLQAETAADVGLDLRWHVRERSDRAGELSDTDGRPGAADALDVARDLGRANPGGAYEIRPVGVLHPGSLPT